MGETEGGGAADAQMKEWCVPSDATLEVSSSSLYACLEVVGAAPKLPRVVVSPETLQRRSSLSVAVVGRQVESCDIRIDHGSISRKHALLYYRKGASVLFVQDLGGKHGTFVNGTRVPPKTAHALQATDVLLFGKAKTATFRVLYPKDSTAPETAASEDARIHTKDSDDKDKNPTKESEDASMEWQLKKPQTGKDVAASSEEQEHMDCENDNDDDDGDAKISAHRPLQSAREQRQREIEAMIASLDEQPTYKPHQEESPPPPLDADQTKKLPPSHVVVATAAAVERKIPIAQVAKISFSMTLPETRDRDEETHTHGKVITCVAFDTLGSRFVTGCSDGVLRLYDFGGMDATHRPFRAIHVEEGHPIVDVAYSNTGDRILVGTTSAQPKVLDRDGKEIIQFVKGDVYVTDQARTSGHTAAVTSVAWHPLERDVVLTASMDGSARFWNVTTGRLQFKKLVCEGVLQPKDAKGRRTRVTCARFHPTGRELALVTMDGSLQLWKLPQRSRPERVVYHAHGPAKPLVAVAYNAHGTAVATTGTDGDDIVAVWETASLTKSSAPLAAAQGNDTLHEGCNLAWSPNAKILCAGTCVDPARQKGGAARPCLKFYQLPRPGTTVSSSSSSPAVDPVVEVDLPTPGSNVVCMAWHPKLNQILVGASDGSAFLFYDRSLSWNGALLSTSRGAKRKDDLSLLLESRAPTGSAAVTGTIVAPQATTSRKRKRDLERERQEAVNRCRPEPPATGKTRMGGSSSTGLSFHQYILQRQQGGETVAGRDPRSELFQYAQGKDYVSTAYRGDRERILTRETAEQEEEKRQTKNDK